MFPAFAIKYWIYFVIHDGKYFSHPYGKSNTEMHELCKISQNPDIDQIKICKIFDHFGLYSIS